VSVNLASFALLSNPLLPRESIVPSPTRGF
jgi:hypothetical protein